MNEPSQKEVWAIGGSDRAKTVHSLAGSHALRVVQVPKVTNMTPQAPQDAIALGPEPTAFGRDFVHKGDARAGRHRASPVEEARLQANCPGQLCQHSPERAAGGDHDALVMWLVDEP